QLAIFDLAAPGTANAALQAVTPPQPQLLPAHVHEVWGTIATINGAVVTLKTREGAHIQVDTADAELAGEGLDLFVNEAVAVRGRYDESNVLHATTISNAKASPALWPADR